MTETHKAALSQGMTVAEWVRQALRAARRQQQLGDIEKRVELVRAASRHSYPTADVDEMLSQIEQGYVAEDKVDPD